MSRAIELRCKTKGHKYGSVLVIGEDIDKEEAQGLLDEGNAVEIKTVSQKAPSSEANAELEKTKAELVEVNAELEKAKTELAEANAELEKAKTKPAAKK